MAAIEGATVRLLRVNEDARGRILALTEQLSAPELSLEARLVIAAQIRLVLLGETPAFSLETPGPVFVLGAPFERPPPIITSSVN